MGRQTRVSDSDVKGDRVPMVVTVKSSLYFVLPSCQAPRGVLSLLLSSNHIPDSSPCRETQLTSLKPLPHLCFQSPRKCLVFSCPRPWRWVMHDFTVNQEALTSTVHSLSVWPALNLLPSRDCSAWAHGLEIFCVAEYLHIHYNTHSLHQSNERAVFPLDRWGNRGSEQ